MIRPAGVLLDLDGTVYEEDRPIAGAGDAIAALRGAGIAVRFVTNTTRFSRRALRDRLGGFGIAAAVDEILTAPAAAAAWLRDHVIRRADLYVADSTLEDFPEVTIDTAAPEAIVVGDLGPGWTFERLNRAFRQLMAGARLVAVQRNRYWKTADGLSLDAGAFVTALEYAAGVEATLVGKPSPAFYAAAVASLGAVYGPVVMVGDDVASDVAGAQAAGHHGVLVRTGKYQAGDETRITPGPEAVVGSVAELPAVFGVSRP